MKAEFPTEKYPVLRYFLGDVRDKERLKRALEGVDYVIHAAALKQVPAAEDNPIEFIKTNIGGAQNIIEAALDTGVKKVVALSTDKASSPCTLYGATKLVSDKLFISANNIRGARDLSFSVVRYGNVFNSRGSVVEVFKSQKNDSEFSITDSRMTRFIITLRQGVEWVLRTLVDLPGNVLLVPKLPSMRVIDLATAFDPAKKFKIIGVRSGEKIHEEMISTSDSPMVLESTDHFLIVNNHKIREECILSLGYKTVADDFRYESSGNNNFLNFDEICALIRES
jgi:FlaA1/EpsC-like NDP-sugar epimerase